MNRYSRHTVLPAIGQKGQEKIKDGTVAIVGLGGLGSTMSDALVRCGVGTVIIMDDDTVEMSNLQRQNLYDEKDVGEKKAEVAQRRLEDINSNVKIVTEFLRLKPKNAVDSLKRADIVLDATDNIQTRFVINDACVKLDKPWIYTAVLQTYGMSLNIIPGEGPCLRCFLSEVPDPDSMESCESAGILFSLPKVMGEIAATEAVKYITGNNMREEMLTIDFWENEYDLTEVARDEDCKTCQEREFEFLA